MVGFASVASFSLDTKETFALPGHVITFLRTVPVTVALSAILVGHCVAVEPGLAPFAAIAVRVEQTHLAQTSQVIASIWICCIDISITRAWLTESTNFFRVAKITGSTSFTTVPNIVRLTHTNLFRRIQGRVE